MSTTTKTAVSSTGSRHKKKSAPGGAPIPEQDNGTTFDSIAQAEFLFSLIGTGRKYAVSRPKGTADRQLRRLIQEANNSGDCIINVGDGYYRPGENDEAEAAAYFAQERRRAREILRKVRRMEDTFNRRYQTWE